MKVLFLCKGNAERSMAAETLFNKLSKKNIAKSARIDVIGEKGEGLGPSPITAKLLLDKGHNVSNHRRRHITKQMLDQADRIILILSKKEMGLLPESLKGSDKVTIWELEGNVHTPAAHSERLESIEKRVMELVNEIG